MHPDQDKFSVWLSFVAAVTVFVVNNDVVCGFLPHICAVLRFLNPPYPPLHERVTKSSENMWKIWQLKLSVRKGAKFWQKWQTIESREKCGDYRKFYCFVLSLRHKKGVPFW